MKDFQVFDGRTQKNFYNNSANICRIMQNIAQLYRLSLRLFYYLTVDIACNTLIINIVNVS
jgi:hypothetical protein